MNAKGSNSPVILSAVRTPIGRLGSALASVPASELGATVVRAAVERAALADHAEIDEVFMGNVVSAGLGQNIARQTAIFGGTVISLPGSKAGNFGKPPDTIANLKDRLSKFSRTLPLVE